MHQQWRQQNFEPVEESNGSETSDSGATTSGGGVVMRWKRSNKVETRYADEMKAHKEATCRVVHGVSTDLDDA